MLIDPMFRSPWVRYVAPFDTLGRYNTTLLRTYADIYFRRSILAAWLVLTCMVVLPDGLVILLPFLLLAYTALSFVAFLALRQLHLQRKSPWRALWGRGRERE